MIPLVSAAEGGEIYRYATTIIGQFGAPTGSMFILAMLWSGTTEVVSTVTYYSAIQSDVPAWSGATQTFFHCSSPTLDETQKIKCQLT